MIFARFLLKIYVNTDNVKVILKNLESKEIQQHKQISTSQQLMISPNPQNQTKFNFLKFYHLSQILKNHLNPINIKKHKKTQKKHKKTLKYFEFLKKMIIFYSQN